MMIWEGRRQPPFTFDMGRAASAVLYFCDATARWDLRRSRRCLRRWSEAPPQILYRNYSWLGLPCGGRGGRGGILACPGLQNLYFSQYASAPPSRRNIYIFSLYPLRFTSGTSGTSAKQTQVIDFYSNFLRRYLAAHLRDLRKVPHTP